MTEGYETQPVFVVLVMSEKVEMLWKIEVIALCSTVIMMIKLLNLEQQQFQTTDYRVPIVKLQMTPAEN